MRTTHEIAQHMGVDEAFVSRLNQSIAARVQPDGDHLIWVGGNTRPGKTGGTFSTTYAGEPVQIPVRRYLMYAAGLLDTLRSGGPKSPVVTCTCGAPDCVNPQHLLVVPTLGQAISARLRGQVRKGPPKNTLPPEVADAVAVQYAAFIPVKTIAAEFGVSPNAVRRVVKARRL